MSQAAAVATVTAAALSSKAQHMHDVSFVPVENAPSASCRIACRSFIRDDRSSVAMETIAKQFTPTRMNASLLRLMIFLLTAELRARGNRILYELRLQN